MNLNIFQETNPVSGANQLVGAIYKNSAPTILIASFPYPGPYTGQTQLHTFPSLLNVAYLYICYESPDGSPSGTIRNQFVVQPSNDIFQTRDDLYLIAGVSANMLAGQPNYGPDATLVGWNWSLERVSQGTQEIGVQYVKTKAGVDTTQDDINADGFRLAAVGDIFADEEDFVIHFYPQVTTSTNPPPTNIISAVNLITTSEALGTDAPGQSFLIQGASGFVQVTLPSLASTPDAEVIYFDSCGGSHINASIVAGGTDKIQYYQRQSDFTGGNLTNHLILGQCETLALYKWTNPITSKAVWLILYMDKGYQMVGERVNSLSQQMMNTVILKGQLLSRVNYARLWEYVSNLESGLLVPESTWNLASTNQGPNLQTYYVNKGRFSTGDGSTTFRIPDMTIYGYERTVQAGAAQFFMNTVAAHDHTMHGSGTFNGSGGPYYFARNLNGSYSQGGADLVGRKAGSPDITLRTGKDVDAPGGGNVFETIPNSFATYPLIRI